MGLMDFLKGNKKEQEKEPETMREAQILLSNTRAKMQQLISKMEIVDFDDIRKRVPEEVISIGEMADYKRTFDIMIKKLQSESSAELALLDTDSIDSDMIYFVEHFEKELREGHKSTADAYLTGLKYGIAKGHASIPSTEVDNSMEIMSQRIDRLRKYKDIASLYSQIENTEKVRNVQQEDYKKLKEHFMNFYEDLQKDMIIQKAVVEKIQRVGMSKITSVDAEAYTMVQRMNYVTTTKKQLEDKKHEISLLDGRIDAMRTAVNELNSTLMNLDNTIDDSLFERLDDYRRKHDNVMKSVIEETVRLREYTDRFHNSMEQLFSDAKMIDEVVRISMEFEETQRKIKQEQEDEAEGMRNYQEYLESQENQNQENEQRQLLNN